MSRIQFDLNPTLDLSNRKRLQPAPRGGTHHCSRLRVEAGAVHWTFDFTLDQTRRSQQDPCMGALIFHCEQLAIDIADEDRTGVHFDRPRISSLRHFGFDEENTWL